MAIKVPIVDYGGKLQELQSGDSLAAPRFIGAKVRYDLGIQTIPDSTDTVLQWDIEEYDTDNMYDSGTDPTKLIAPTDGFYIPQAELKIDASGSRAGVIRIHLVKKGVFEIGMLEIPNLGTSGYVLQVHSVVYLDAEDYVQVYMYQDSGGGQDVLDTVSWFAMSKIG